MIADFYLSGNSPIHRFDGRAKIICLIGSAASFFYPLPLFWSAAYLVFWSLITALSLGVREILVPYRSILPILILVAVLTPLFNRQGQILVSAGTHILATSGGLLETGRMLIRFSGVTVIFFLFFRTTELTEILLTLRAFGLSFRAALVVSIAFRYIPELSNLFRQVREAHTLRRPSGETDRGPVKRLTSFFPTLTSVLIQAIKGIDPLSMALEAKGVGRRNKRTSYRALKGGFPVFAETLLSCMIVLGELLPLFFIR